jgi:hypothetical protein
LCFQQIAIGLPNANSVIEFGKDDVRGRVEGAKTLKIEKKLDRERMIISLAGRIRSGGLDELKAQIADNTKTTILDLHEVTLVDVHVVRFLSSCEETGIRLARCPSYVREWILRERAEGKDQPS